MYTEDLIFPGVIIPVGEGVLPLKTRGIVLSSCFVRHSSDTTDSDPNLRVVPALQGDLSSCDRLITNGTMLN